MQERFQRSLFFALYAIIFSFYAIVGLIAAHPFDDPIYAQHAQFFYYLMGNPVFSLGQGIYYDLINIGGYFPTIIISLFGVSNVLTLQVGVKSSFIVFAFLTSYFLYRIVDRMGYNGNYASLLLLTSPLYFFTSVIYGSALIVSMFFMVASIYFLFDDRISISAALFGVAVGTYLYPVFSIPFLLRYVNKVEGRKEAVFYLFISAAFAAVGQLSVLFIYVKSGYYGFAPTTPTNYLSAMPVPFYSIFDIFNLFGVSRGIPGQIYNYVYYASAAVASLTYFIKKKEKVDKVSLLIFFLIQGILFSSLNPYNLPSYMSAMIPFAILLAIIDRRWLLIGMMWISSALSFAVMETINSVGFLIYFSDINLKILKVSNAFSPLLKDVFGFVYSLSLLVFIPVSLRMKPGNLVRFKKTLVSQFSIIGALTIVALLILIPVSSNIPGNFYLEGDINSFQAQVISDSMSGNSLVVEYSIPVVGMIGKNYSNSFVGLIELSSTKYVIYNTSKSLIVPPGDYEKSLVLSFPAHSTNMELFGTSNGTVGIQLTNATSTVFPNSETVTTLNETVFEFVFNTTLAGSYTLDLVSNVSLYGSNSISPSIFLSSSPALGKVVVGGYLIVGNTLPGNLMKSRLNVTFSGPFIGKPPFEPSIIVYLSKNLVDPQKLPTIEGGLFFVTLILLPSSLILYYIVRGRQKTKDSLI